MTSPRQQQSSLSPTQVQAISVAVADAVALGLHHFNSQRTGSGAVSSDFSWLHCRSGYCTNRRYQVSNIHGVTTTSCVLHIHPQWTVCCSAAGKTMHRSRYAES